MGTVEVEIIGQAITARYGTLNTGDILRTTPEFARHLVEDCSAAKYCGNGKEAAPAKQDNKVSESTVVTPARAPNKVASEPKAAKSKPSKAG